MIQPGIENTVSRTAFKDKCTLAGLGVKPTPMNDVLPTHMWRFRQHGEFERVEA